MEQRNNTLVNLTEFFTIQNSIICSFNGWITGSPIYALKVWQITNQNRYLRRKATCILV
jgi:hypothetical protein